MGEAATRLTWGGLLRAMGTWLRENLPRALLMSAVSFAFGWLVNFWVMAFRWDGFRAPTGQSDYITAENSVLLGTLFWVALMSFLFAVVSYGFRAGWGQLAREVLGLPKRMAGMFRGEERNRSLTALLWALMLGLLLSLVISPGVAAVTAGFFLAFAATPLGQLLTGVLRRLWVQVVARFAPHKGEPTSEVGGAAVTAVGMLLGFLVAVSVDILAVKLLALVLAGLAAYYFANEDQLGPSGGTAVLLLMAAAVGLHELFDVGIAFADDGGWSECGNCNVIDYVRSTGATEVVSRSTVAGGGAAVGAPIGAAAGDVLGSMGGGAGGGGVGGGTGGGAGGTGAGTGGTGGSGGPGGGTATPADAGGATVHTATTDGGVEQAPPPGQDAPPATSDSGDILGAIGGGEGGAAGTAAAPGGGDAGTGTTPADAPQGPSDEPATTAPAPGTAGRQVRSADEDVAPAPDAPDAGGATGDADAGGGASNADAGATDPDAATDSGDILGAIGGGEGGATAGSTAGAAAPADTPDDGGGTGPDAIARAARRSTEQDAPLAPDAPDDAATEGTPAPSTDDASAGDGEPGEPAPPPPDEDR